MNQAKAVSKYQRISPQKARLAAGLIRGLPVAEAMHQLIFSKLKGGRLLSKTLKSAIANAETLIDDARQENLKVTEVRIDEGSRMKRARARSRGGRSPIIKRTSHFTIVVSKE
jgi:large subunit ribosomal protein L22